MSNFSKPNATSLTGILEYLNTITEPAGMFSIFFIFTFFIINLMALSRFRPQKNNITVALFNTTILSIFMLAMDLFTGTSIVFLLILGLVGSVIYSWYQGS